MWQRLCTCFVVIIGIDKINECSLELYLCYFRVFFYDVWCLKPMSHVFWPCCTKHYCNVYAEIKCDRRCITKASETKFLGLLIDDTLSWKQHIDQVVSKMCFSWHAIWNIKSLGSPDTLRIIYFACIHSILKYGIIFWGNSSYSNKVFILQKKLLEL